LPKNEMSQAITCQLWKQLIFILYSGRDRL